MKQGCPTESGFGASARKAKTTAKTRINTELKQKRKKKTPQLWNIKDLHGNVMQSWGTKIVARHESTYLPTEIVFKSCQHAPKQEVDISPIWRDPLFDSCVSVFLTD